MTELENDSNIQITGEDYNRKATHTATASEIIENTLLRQVAVKHETITANILGMDVQIIATTDTKTTEDLHKTEIATTTAEEICNTGILFANHHVMLIIETAVSIGMLVIEIGATIAMLIIETAVMIETLIPETSITSGMPIIEMADTITTGKYHSPEILSETTTTTVI